MKRRSAFTLVEVLAAIVVISIVVPVAMQGVSLALAAAQNARKSAEAAQLAESKLAEVTTQTTLMAGSQGGTFDTMPGYSWQAQTVSRDMGLLEVTVQVTWTARGAPRTVSVSSWVYSSGALQQ